MRNALFLLPVFWTAFAAAQTSLTFVGAPNSEYRRISTTFGRHSDYWDIAVMRTEAGYQGIAGARIGIPLVRGNRRHFTLSPGSYAVFGERRELFGPGLGLGWEGEWKRFETEGLVIQYINSNNHLFYRYTLGEGELSARLIRGLHATGGGEMVHNDHHQPAKIRWGGGLAYKRETATGNWALFARSRGREAQIGLAWSPPEKEHR